MADYVCQECGHEYEEIGGGKCYVCGGNIIPIEEVGTEEEEYPEELMEEETAVPPEETPEEEESWGYKKSSQKSFKKPEEV